MCLWQFTLHYKQVCLLNFAPVFQLGGFGGGAGGFFPGVGQKAAKRGTTGGKKCLMDYYTGLL